VNRLRICWEPPTTHPTCSGFLPSCPWPKIACQIWEIQRPWRFLRQFRQAERVQAAELVLAQAVALGWGHGPGVGAGSGGGIGGGVFKVWGGISAPQAVSTPDPEYTEEARLAKTQRPRENAFYGLSSTTGDIRATYAYAIVRGLGFGLDAKAIEAVKQWRFQPALKDGRAVSVQISVEVGFHLY
jgi:hypothetical protein